MNPENDKRMILGRGVPFSEAHKEGCVKWRNLLMDAYTPLFSHIRRLLLYIGDQHWANAAVEGAQTTFQRFDNSVVPQEEQHSKNYMGRLFRDLKAMALKNAPIPQADPAPGNIGYDIKHFASIVENIIRKYFLLWDMDVLLDTIYNWNIPSGYGFAKILMQNGHVHVEPLTAYSVMADPMAKSWGKSRRFLHEEYLHVEEIWETFEDNLKEQGVADIDALLKLKSEKSQTQTYFEDYLKLLPNGHEISGELSSEYMPIDQFYFDPIRNYVLPAAENGNSPLDLSRGRITTVVGDKIVQDATWGLPDGVAKGDFFNLIPFYWQTMPGTVLGQGAMETLRTCQMSVNALARKAYKKIQTDVSGLQVPQGARFGGQADSSIPMSHIPADDGQLIYVEGAGGEVKSWQFAPSYEGYVMLMEREIMRMKDLAGVRLPRIATSGKERLIIGQEDEERLNDPTSNLVNAVETLCNTAVRWIFHFESPEFLASLGNTRPEIIVKIKDLLNKIQITMVVGSASPKNKSVVALEVLQKAKIFKELPPQYQRVVLKILNEREEWTEVDPEYPHYERARWENEQWEKGSPETEWPVSESDNHDVHVREHDNAILESLAYPLPPDIADRMLGHKKKHVELAIKQGATQSESKPEVEDKGTGGASPIDQLAGGAANQVNRGELMPTALQPNISNLAAP